MSSREDVTAIVLAGGRGSRFGGAKLAAEIAGVTILDRAIRSVDAVAGEIILAGADAPEEAGAREPTEAAIWTLPDAEPFAGPLLALAGALARTTTPYALVVGGDMPALVPAVLARMLDRLDSMPLTDALILEEPGTDRRQVLPLAVRTSPARQAIEASIQAGERSLHAFLDRTSCSTDPAEAWLRLDPTGQTALDIDRPADLDRARKHNFR